MKYIKCKFSVWERFEVQTVVLGYSVKTDFYELHPDGRLVVEKGYAWDGATGAFDTDDFIKASCIHDILCELINTGILPDFVQALADEEMRRIAKRQKMFWLRRMWTYLIVRFYQINKKPGYKRPIFEVP